MAISASIVANKVMWGDDMIKSDTAFIIERDVDVVVVTNLGERGGADTNASAVDPRSAGVNKSQQSVTAFRNQDMLLLLFREIISFIVVVVVERMNIPVYCLVR